MLTHLTHVVNIGIINVSMLAFSLYYSLTELLALFQTLVLLLTVSTFMLIINVSCAFGYYNHNWFCMTAVRLAENSFSCSLYKEGLRDEHYTSVGL